MQIDPVFVEAILINEDIQTLSWLRRARELIKFKEDEHICRILNYDILKYDDDEQFSVVLSGEHIKWRVHLNYADMPPKTTFDFSNPFAFPELMVKCLENEEVRQKLTELSEADDCKHTLRDMSLHYIKMMKDFRDIPQRLYGYREFKEDRISYIEFPLFHDWLDYILLTEHNPEHYFIEAAEAMHNAKII